MQSKLKACNHSKVAVATTTKSIKQIGIGFCSLEREREEVRLTKRERQKNKITYNLTEFTVSCDEVKGDDIVTSEAK